MATRAFFQGVTAEVGGERFNLSGSVSYTDLPLRYDVSVRTDRVRIRYPEGMSWLVGGNLRLTGTPDYPGLLSGKVVVERVNLNAGVESAAVLFSGNGIFPDHPAIRRSSETCSSIFPVFPVRARAHWSGPGART